MATDEPFTHEILFCGTYLGFILVSAFGALNLLDANLNYRIEAASGMAGFILFIVASIWSMVNVEKDQHLESLNDSEEYQHLYFQINRFQSVSSLITGMTFLLHMLLSIDLILDERPNLSNRSSANDSDVEKYQPLELKFFPETIWNYIRRKFKRQ
jgi:uncharacterized membrane protein (DUF485 family)